MGQVVRKKDVPIPAILIPATSIIGPAPTARRQDNQIIARQTARRRAEGVDYLDDHLFALGVAAGPGELVAFTAR